MHALAQLLDVFPVLMVLWITDTVPVLPVFPFNTSPACDALPASEPLPNVALARVYQVTLASTVSAYSGIRAHARARAAGFYRQLLEHCGSLELLTPLPVMRGC